MRLLALTGERDGHMGLFPLFAGHARPFHFLPVRLYAFADGIYVIAAPGRPELVRTRWSRSAKRRSTTWSRA